ncbi:phosphotransferase family protein [Asanoa ferruginea]|uniref:phosphotransferase family protein n=1 Tax=Asanoa ferruginea TaxID=53367 RepID=UPI001EF276AC|nr:aminoglycoside phosphotransferase family protein [Asanoa ferruginea]
MAGTDVPAARLHAVDATAAHCAHPSLLMSLLPGEVRLADDLSQPLARQLVDIHRLAVPEHARPRVYQAWTSPDRVPAPTALWRRAVDVIRRDPPPYTGTFLHRDFHPGNVLFERETITGVVDWVETSWGPADLDVAHCATATALLHGPDAGLRFPEHYREAGGRLAEDPEDRRYWCLLDALGFAPDAEKVAGPWRELGRSDLTPGLLTRRLTDYVAALA